VDQRTILFTGLTRDGTFLIENGKVTVRSRTCVGTSRRSSSLLARDAADVRFREA